jgi:hypothetical protein
MIDMASTKVRGNKGWALSRGRSQSIKAQPLAPQWLRHICAVRKALHVMRGATATRKNLFASTSTSLARETRLEPSLEDPDFQRRKYDAYEIRYSLKAFLLYGEK